ncbi:hypothetical protein BDA99DRAFT_500427 [Phascolomyces articulosus]|uniref:CHY-type domain-containing protein n=1 Tax=Phascolomyces articulosus TaxID=60185 RepID=A0AAD5KMP7_9FUNG|nr:hypothetical protein BDA99DRAFT_500427 [Phascolomyces articulosus]
MTESRRPVSKPVVTVARNKDTELSQLERRYRSTFKKVSENDECTIIRLAFPPSDPDFPFELDMLRLQIRIPANYPKESCTIIVMNTDIPKGFAFNLEKGFETYTKQASTTLVRQMNWLDKNMETLLQQEPATTMRFVSTAPKPKPEEESSGLMAPALPDDFIAAATTKVNHNMAAAAAAAAAEASSSSSSVPAIASSSPSSSKPITKEQKQKSTSPPPRQLDADAVPFFTSSQLSEAAEKREKEIGQLQARFRGSYKSLRNDHAETVVQLMLNLEDPDFSYKDVFNKELKVKYHIPIQYPLLPCTIEVENKALGEDEARDISYVFAEHVEKSKRTLFQNLNWLNRNLETILQYPPERPWEIKEEEPTSSDEEEGPILTRKQQEEQDQQQQQFTKNKQVPISQNSNKSLFKEQEEKGARVIVVDDPDFLRPPHLDHYQPKTSTSSNTSSPVDPLSVHPETNEQEEEQVSQPTTTEARKAGTEIYLYHFQLQNVTLFRCVSLNLIVKCNKCKTMTNVENLRPKDPFHPSKKENNESWTTCSKCRNLMGVKFFSDLMHQNSNKLGLLQVSGCLPFDILASKYVGTCIQCMEDEMTMTLTPHDHPSTFRCFGCHTSITMALGDFRFIRVGQEDGERFEGNQSLVSKAVMKRKKKNGDTIQLVVGQSLPDKGTCEHYRKSKRWFRFPCCSRLYACDACHDKNEDHVYELARRHVCGLCSREQAISPMCTCGHVFERGPHSHFWEGGEGTRSKVLMSRKDPHKYKGLGKTVSKKQDRVGVAGKNKRKNE